MLQVYLANQLPIQAFRVLSRIVLISALGCGDAYTAIPKSPLSPATPIPAEAPKSPEPMELSPVLPTLPSLSAGDRVTVINTSVKLEQLDGKEDLTKISIGETLTVDRVDDGKLWIEDLAGYVSRNDVVPFDEAITFFTERIRREPSAETYLHRAAVWAYRDELDIALSDTDEAIKLDAKLPDGYLLRGQIWVLKQTPEMAIADFNELIRLEPNLARSFMMRSRALSDMGEYSKAIKDLNEVIRLDPTNISAFEKRGYNSFKIKDYQGAITNYTEAIRLDPKNAGAYINRGLNWKHLGEVDKSISDFTEAIRLTPTSPESYCCRGSLWFDMQQYQKAISDYTEAIRLDPESSDSYRCRASNWARLKNYEESIADFDAAIRLDPQNSEAYLGRGHLWFAKKDYAKAIEDYSQMIRINPVNAKAFEFRANAYVKLLNYEHAFSDFDESIRLAPMNNLPYLHRGDAWAQKGAFEQAILDYTKAIERNPVDIEQFFESYGQENGDEEGTVERNPEDIEAYVKRGEANLHLSVKPSDTYAAMAMADLKKATLYDADSTQQMSDAMRKKLSECILAEIVGNQEYTFDQPGPGEHEPTNVRVADQKQKIAEAALARGMEKQSEDLAEAEEAFTDAILNDPNMLAAYKSRGDIRMKRENFQGAFADFDRTVELDREDWHAVYDRGHASFRMGDSVAALKDYFAAVKSPHSQGHQKLSGKLRYYDYKDPARLDERIHANPDDLEAYELRADNRIESGNFVGAIADCNAALEIGARNSDLFLPSFAKNAEYQQLLVDNPDYRPRLIASRKSEIIYTRGAAWFKKGDETQAMADYAAHWETIYPRSDWTKSAPPQATKSYYDGRQPRWVFDDGPIRMELERRP